MKKIISYLRWGANMILALVGYITAPIIFPLLYPFRNTWIRNVKPFWYYFDDEDGVYGAEYWKVGKGVTDSFWTAMRWSAFRNPAWNLQSTLVPAEGKEVIVSSKGKLICNGKEVSLLESARLHYVDKNNKFMFNVGDYLSYKYSNIGKSSIWFTKGGKLYWRYTKAKRFGKSKWIEIQIGVTERYVFKVKFNLTAKVYEEQDF